jgi:ATP-dependent helicase/nuclease subunit B
MSPKRQLNQRPISNIESRISNASPISNHIIFTGSFAALESRWIEVIVGLQAEDPLLEINVLIGSNILASYLKRRFARTGRAMTNVRFHTFLDLASRLSAASEHTPEKRRLPNLGNSILLEDILAADTPAVYAPLSSFPGFRAALLDTLRDLRDAGIAPQDMLDAMGIDPGMKDRSRHLSGLADLYRRFRERVGFFHDVDEDFRGAIRNALVAQKTLGSRQLLVYGIYDATGQQSQFLEALKNVFEMIYFIPRPDEFIGEFVQPYLQSRMQELDVECIHLPGKQPVNSLDHLEASDFGLTRLPGSGTGDSLPADGSFALISVPGESRSAVEVVREIFRAVRDGTICGFHEAAVILRQPENDIPTLSEMFRLRGVPYFIHGGSRFAERPLSKAVVALCNLESNSYSHEAVLTAMELVAASMPAESAAAWDVQTWRSLTNDARFLAGVQSWDKGTETLVGEARKNLRKSESAGAFDSDDDETDRRVESVPLAVRRLESAKALRAGWQLLMQASSGWPAGLSWEGWADHIDRHFEPLLGASEDWAAFSRVLDEIRNLDIIDGFEIRDSRLEIKKPGKAGDQGAKPISAERVRGVVVQAIEGLFYAEGQFQRRGVNLLSTSAARGLRFPLVIIPGLEEGRFPAKLRQDPLLLDSERRRIGRLPIKSRRMEEERLLFDMAARSAEKRLVLMTSRLDESSDRERIPSQFFLRAAAAIRKSVVTVRDLAEGNIPGFRSVSLDNPAPIGDEAAVDEGEIRLRLIAADRDTAYPALKALERLEPLRLTRPLAYDQARWAHRLTSYDGFLTDPELIAWAARTLSAGQVSASRLEEYAKCPYYFYLKRGMALAAWEEPAPLEGMDPLERGLAVHAILENFLKNYCGERFQAASEAELRRSLASLANDALEQARPAGIPDLLWEIERDTFLVLLDRWLVLEKKRAAEGMLPTALEQAFGEIKSGERHPAFCLQAGRHAFDFRGRIDRIDISRDGKQARVIDYKTGSLPDSMRGKGRTPLMSGERIQIVIYRGALSVLNEFQGVEAVEGEYLHLQPKDGQVVQCRFTDEELRESSRTLPAILEIVGDGIESGVFFARTSGTVRPSGHCEYCEYLPVCGKDRVQREERKVNDPAMRRFSRILETRQ